MGPPLRNSGGASGFAVGADDLGGPRAHAVRPYRPIGMFQGGRVRAPAPTAYPKVRLSFVGPDAPIGPFPCGPVCRPYEISANIRRDPDLPALPAFYLE